MSSQSWYRLYDAYQYSIRHIFSLHYVGFPRPIQLRVGVVRSIELEVGVLRPFELTVGLSPSFLCVAGLSTTVHVEQLDAVSVEWRIRHI